MQSGKVLKGAARRPAGTAGPGAKRRPRKLAFLARFAPGVGARFRAPTRRAAPFPQELHLPKNFKRTVRISGWRNQTQLFLVKLSPHFTEKPAGGAPPF